MSARYRLEPLTADQIAQWDNLITSYDSRQLFHRREWLDYLAASRSVDIRHWSIRDGDSTVGYFCGGLLRKGPFKILGSPLKGWGTNYMGPVADTTFDSGAFLRALDELAAAERIAMIEIESPVVSDKSLAAFSYEPTEQQTYVVDLAPGHPETLWGRIDLKSRQKIKKAQRLNVTVEETTSPELAREFYQQFVEVLARKSLSPPYGPDCPLLLLHCLQPHDLMFGLRVRDPQGAVIATGIFPHDDRTVYFWGGASRIAAWAFSPNDLLQWRAIELACQRGLQRYNMCGYGYFKSKFGGLLERPTRWHKFYSPAARWARRGYELYFEQRIRLRGWWHQRALESPKA